MQPLQRGTTIQRAHVPTGLAYGVSASEKDLSLIHRVDPAEGTSPGTVRVYLTVFAYSDSKYKDIHAQGAGIKLIAKTQDTMFNIGDPRRAFHYYHTYRAQTPAADCPIIRSFDIPKSLYDEVTGKAISESQRAKLGRDNPYNVDKERGQNQFGVHPKLRDEIEKQGRNLISYVAADKMASLSSNPANGTVKDVNELRRHLGMPTEAVHFLAPLRDAHVLSPREEAVHGALLTRLYDDLDALVRVRSEKVEHPHTRRLAEKKIADACVSTNPGYYGEHIATRVRAQAIPSKTAEALKFFRDEIGRAATFSVIPQMVTEEYLQANARLHAGDQLKATLTRIGADLDELIAARSDPRLAARRAGVELDIANKCAPASPLHYGRRLGSFIRAKRIYAMSLPELSELRQKVGRAASGAGVVLSTDEAYMRDVNAFAPDVRDKNNNRLSPWAAGQQYRILTPPPYVAPVKQRGKPSDEEIDRLRKEKAARKQQ